jgi:hypothetical protein
VLVVKVQSWDTLWSDEAGPDLGFPRALAGGVCFPYSHGVLVIVDDGMLLLDPSGLGLEG